jgi:hypothetical protein
MSRIASEIWSRVTPSQLLLTSEQRRKYNECRQTEINDTGFFRSNNGITKDCLEEARRESVPHPYASKGGRRRTKKGRKGGLVPFIPNSVRGVFRPEMASKIEICKARYPQSNPLWPSTEYTTCLDENTNRGKALGVVANNLLAPDRSNTRYLHTNYGGRRSKKNRKTKRKGGKSRKARK